MSLKVHRVKQNFDIRLYGTQVVTLFFVYLDLVPDGTCHFNPSFIRQLSGETAKLICHNNGTIRRVCDQDFEDQTTSCLSFPIFSTTRGGFGRITNLVSFPGSLSTSTKTPSLGETENSFLSLIW